MDGIGAVVAMEILIVTNEFKSFSSPKKFACYCGVAPFEYSSGTSLKAKARVSRAVNRRMRTLLFMASISVTRMKGELKNFYDKKVSEGRPKMSVLNAVRNKLIHRIFACVRDGKMYTK